MNDLLEVEVVAYVLGSMDHCTHCQVFLDGAGLGDQIHQADMDSYPPELMDEWQQLSDIIFTVTERFAGRLTVKITDAQSPQAIWKALRKGVRKYPTFLVEDEKYHGLNQDQIVELIERHLPQASG